MIITKMPKQGFNQQVCEEERCSPVFNGIIQNVNSSSVWEVVVLWGTLLGSLQMNCTFTTGPDPHQPKYQQ